MGWDSTTTRRRARTCRLASILSAGFVELSFVRSSSSSMSRSSAAAMATTTTTTRGGAASCGRVRAGDRLININPFWGTLRPTATGQTTGESRLERIRTTTPRSSDVASRATRPARHGDPAPGRGASRGPAARVPGPSSRVANRSILRERADRPIPALRSMMISSSSRAISSPRHHPSTPSPIHHLTLVPIRPRSRGERRSLRT